MILKFFLRSFSPALLTASILGLFSMEAVYGQEMRPVENKALGFFVKNAKIYDPTGKEFVPMGFNGAVFFGENGPCKLENVSKHIPASGANVLRINTQMYGSFGWNADPATQRELVERSVSSGMVPILEMHDATCGKDLFDEVVAYWLSDEMVQLSKDYERELWINIANEHNFSSAAVFRKRYIDAIGRMRAAGINNLIVVDSGSKCGQGADFLEQEALAILDADPMKNVLFSVHMYGHWKTDEIDLGEGRKRYSVERDLPRLKRMGIPIMVGEFGWDVPDGWVGNYDPRTLLDVCRENGIGWCFWAFHDGGGNGIKPFYSIVKDVCAGLSPENVTPAGEYLIDYLRAHAKAADFGSP